jgi:Fe2+ transport system protein FeoA
MTPRHNNEDVKRLHEKAVIPLTALSIREKGRIVYLQTKGRKEMQKLMSIGMLPGMGIVVSQKFPSYVVTLGQSQFAIDKELAAAVFVQKVK